MFDKSCVPFVCDPCFSVELVEIVSEAPAKN